MRSVLAVSVLALSPWPGHAAGASEGRISPSAPVAPDPARTSRYESAPAEAGAKAAATAQTRKHAAQKAPGSRALRSASASLSVRSSYFYIYDAGSLLITDRDGDDYHSEFRIRFDADSTVGDALVYAALYIRRVGDDVDWTLYHTTDDFWIYGQSTSDDYYVTTTLDDGFPTGDYDVLIDLYEVGYSDMVATIGPSDSGALGYLPLEEAGLDIPAEIPGYDIHDVTTTLIIDSDQDGYYSRFGVDFDPDADFDGSLVYAIVWVRPQGGEWIEEFVSDDFPVDAAGSADAYRFTADWSSGYPTSYYDVQIDLHDSATGLLVASAGSERPELSRLPLEDQTLDRAINPPSTGGSGSEASSRERGGGAQSFWWSLGLLSLAVGRRAAATRSRSAGSRASGASPG
ncbi:MAG: choice-of-anchor H family protein [Steroidobacter sp.]